MKIIFFGSGKIAVRILEAIHRSTHEILLVVTQPDRKKGRHLRLSGTPVKEYALFHHLNIFQPEQINRPESIEVLKKQASDVFVVVSYGNILSKRVLGIPEKMCLNIHASVLPKYRGAAPINWALINGERTTGLTFMKMNEHMDQGDIIFQTSIRIADSDHALSLEEKLSFFASSHILEILEKIENNNVVFKKQNEKDATFAPLIKKHDGLIQWDSGPEKIYNLFRGCFGWPGVFTYYQGKMLKILGMETTHHTTEAEPGEIVRIENNLLEVACSSGTVLIKEVLPESHKRMLIVSFLAGHKVKIGDVLGK